MDNKLVNNHNNKVNNPINLLLVMNKLKQKTLIFHPLRNLLEEEEKERMKNQHKNNRMAIRNMKRREQAMNKAIKNLLMLQK